MNAFATAVLAALCAPLVAQTTETAKTPPAPPLSSAVFDWTKLVPTPTATGERRPVFDGVSATADNVHCHITTLQRGAASGEPRLHLLEEIIIIKEGTVEVSVDGRLQNAGPGSVVFFASRAVTRLRNVGDGPTTYYVISFVTPATPKS